MTTIRFNRQVAALAMGLALGGGAMAQSGTPGGTSGPSVSTVIPATKASSSVARGDRSFMIKAAEDGMFELEAAKLAAGKATSPEVKSFASKMVDDHARTNSELMQLAGVKGVPLPTAMPGGKRRDLERMNKLTGEKFDREFAREIGIDAHKKDIKLFEKHSKDAKDPELKAFVDKTLPGLRMHLDQAMRLPQNKGKS